MTDRAASETHDLPADPASGGATRRVLAAGAFVVALALLVVFAVVANAHSGFLYRLDHSVATSLHSFARHHHAAVDAGNIVSTVGDPTVFRVAALVVAVALWLRRRRSAALFTIVAVGGTVALSGVVKSVVDRPRPMLAHPVASLPGGASFPSGHALTSFVAVGALLVLVRPYLRATAFVVLTLVGALVVLAVGIARLVLGVHFLTDVLGGWLIGGLWLAVVAFLSDPARHRTLPPPGHRIGSRG